MTEIAGGGADRIDTQSTSGGKDEPHQDTASGTGRPRNPALAALLSLLAVGLGQVYNGEWRKALLFFVAIAGMFAVFIALLDGEHFGLGLAIFIVGGGLLRLWMLVDAAVVARRLGASYRLQWFNRVAAYVVIVALSFGFTSFIKANFVRAFRMPSASMEPTLKIGDYIFANMNRREPARGDLIVHRFPSDPSKIFVKRVVALGGDTMQIRDKHLYLEGRLVPEPYTIHEDPVVRPGDQDPRDNFGPYVVPEGSAFVLGDNRDNSNDGRYWGPLQRSHVIGTVRGIYWSWDGAHGGVRWNRIGMRPR